MSAQMVDAETGEIIATGTDLVLAANMADLDRLDAHGREVAVTGMLEQARAWLLHAKASEDTKPQDITDFRAYLLTAAEAAKRVNVSKEIQNDAAEILRRAERELGLAIRRGQEAGEIRTPRDNDARRPPSGPEEGQKASPYDFVPGGSTIDEIHKMTDPTDEQFDAAISEAKDEQNLSRANVVRKIKGQTTKVPVSQQLDRIEELAADGYHSTQIATELGTTSDNIRNLARKAGIEIPADKVLRGAQHSIDMTRYARETVAAIENAASGLARLNYHQIDIDEATEQNWVATLDDSLRALNRFRKHIKEMTTHVQP